LLVGFVDIHRSEGQAGGEAEKQASNEVTHA